MKFSSNQKILLIVSGIVLVLGVFIATVVFLFLNLRSAKNVVSDPEPLLQIKYCGVRLEQICILSFSRNRGGDSLINLFVPSEVPDFYLDVRRLTNESIYECEKDEDEETNVTCVGEALNLGEQIEITMISKNGEIPFAIGKFVLTAVLISSEPEDENPPPSRTTQPATVTQPVSTLETTTSTSTPEVPYPSYP